MPGVRLQLGSNSSQRPWGTVTYVMPPVISMLASGPSRSARISSSIDGQSSDGTDGVYFFAARAPSDGLGLVKRIGDGRGFLLGIRIFVDGLLDQATRRFRRDAGIDRRGVASDLVAAQVGQVAVRLAAAVAPIKAYGTRWPRRSLRRDPGAGKRSVASTSDPTKERRRKRASDTGRATFFVVVLESGR